MQSISYDSMFLHCLTLQNKSSNFLLFTLETKHNQNNVLQQNACSYFKPLKGQKLHSTLSCELHLMQI